MRGDQDPNTRPAGPGGVSPLPWPSTGCPSLVDTGQNSRCTPRSPTTGALRSGSRPWFLSLRGPPLPCTHQLLAPRQTLGDDRRVGRRLRRSLRAEAQEQRCCEQVPPHFRVGTAGEPLWIQTVMNVSLVN